MEQTGYTFRLGLAVVRDVTAAGTVLLPAYPALLLDAVTASAPHTRIAVGPLLCTPVAIEPVIGDQFGGSLVVYGAADIVTVQNQPARATRQPRPKLIVVHVVFQNWTQIRMPLAQRPFRFA